MRDYDVVLLTKDKASGGASNEDVKVGPVPQGVVWELPHVAAEDETTACTYLRIGIIRRGVFIPLLEQVAPAAGRLYHSDEPLFLEENDELVARFNGSTSGDKLTLTANGKAKPASP